MIRISDLPKRFAANKGRILVSSSLALHSRRQQQQQQARRPLSLLLGAAARPTSGLLRPLHPHTPAVAAALLHASARAAKPPPSIAALEEDELPNNNKVPKTLSHAAAGASEDVATWEENVREEERAWLTGPRARDWWTGPVPEPGHNCPGILPDGTLTSLPLPQLRTATRQDLLAYFDNTWALTESLFAGLQGPEAFYQLPYHHLRHPLMFYYGHPAVLYVNKMRVAGLLDGPVHAGFESLFETGVDEMSWDDLSKNHKAWPSVREVWAYRQQVYDTVKHAIRTHPAFDSLAADVENSPFWSLVMGFEHERIHIETSSVLFRELPINRVQPPPQWPRPHPQTFAARGSPLSRPVAGVDYPHPAFTTIEANTVALGKPEGFPSFGWDNEYGAKIMEVEAFEAGRYKVSNGQFYQFVAEGGYFDRANWSKDGWGWRCFRNVRHPPFWVPTGPSGLQAYRLRTVFEEVDMPWACPVEVNYHEAKAFAAWLSRKEQGGGEGSSSSYRLTTEAEHHLMRDPPASAEDDAVLRHSGAAFGHQDQEGQGQANINLAYGMASPVDAYPPSRAGVHDAVGSAWEWCEDHFSPLPGFKTHHHYEDFSLPCFDGQHHLIMGGSFASTGDEASRFARFHFRPHFHQHAGFRLIRPLNAQVALRTSCMDSAGPFAGAENPYRSSAASSAAALEEQEKRASSVAANRLQYEDQEWLQRYLHLHFPDTNDDSACPPFLPKEALDFPRRCADKLANAAASVGASTTRALDLGCAVGGSSFALARHYGEVHGLELSEAFVEAAKTLQREGSLPYAIRSEGEATLPLTARLPSAVDASRVSFVVGDVLALPTELGGRPTRHAFDAVLMANVLCRLPDPRAALTAIAGEEHGVVAPGGLFLLTTPFSWKAEFTPKERWFGGALLEGEATPKSSLQELKAFMASLGYALLESEDMPLVIRQHARLYELIGAHATLWQRERKQ